MTSSDIRIVEGVAPATPRARRTICGARMESAHNVAQARPLNSGMCPRAARDTCAPRALLRWLTSRNPLAIQGLQSWPARGARGSRDTSAAQRLSSDFSYLLLSIGCSRLPGPSASSGQAICVRCSRTARSSPSCRAYPVEIQSSSLPLLQCHQYPHSILKSPASRIPYILRTYDLARFCSFTIRARGVRGGRSVSRGPRAATWKMKSIEAPATQSRTDRDKKWRGVRSTLQS